VDVDLRLGVLFVWIWRDESLPPRSLGIAGGIVHLIQIAQLRLVIA